MRMKSLQYEKFHDPTLNFSELADYQMEGLSNEVDESVDKDIDKEIFLLNALSGLRSDKEKVVFMLEILREYGYQLDYRSISKSLKINLRWFYRIKKNVKTKVQQITM